MPRSPGASQKHSNPPQGGNMRQLAPLRLNQGMRLSTKLPSTLRKAITAATKQYKEQLDSFYSTAYHVHYRQPARRFEAPNNNTGTHTNCETTESPSPPPTFLFGSCIQDPEENQPPQSSRTRQHPWSRSAYSNTAMLELRNESAVEVKCN